MNYYHTTTAAVAATTSRPIESHSEAWETIIAGPCHNPITYVLKLRGRGALTPFI